MMRNDIRGRDQEDEQQKKKTELLCRFAAFVNQHRLSPPLHRLSYRWYDTSHQDRERETPDLVPSIVQTGSMPPWYHPGVVKGESVGGASERRLQTGKQTFL